VTNDEGVLLGSLGAGALDADPQALVEDVMESSPTTIRPDEPLEAVTERMRDQRVGSNLVTTPDGRLVGILYRRDAEQRLKESAS
jgi:CBS domain-containing protein